MMTQIISPQTAEHYQWGDGWHLVRTTDLSIIEELMPPGTSEVLPLRSRQFFYVLEGELTVEVEQSSFVLQAGTGIEVSPGQYHQIFNRSSTLHAHTSDQSTPKPRRQNRSVNKKFAGIKLSFCYRYLDSSRVG